MTLAELVNLNGGGCSCCDADVVSWHLDGRARSSCRQSTDEQLS